MTRIDPAGPSVRRPITAAAGVSAAGGFPAVRAWSTTAGFQPAAARQDQCVARVLSGEARDRGGGVALSQERAHYHIGWALGASLD